MQLWKERGEAVKVDRARWEQETARVLNAVTTAAETRLLVQKERVALMELKQGFLVYDGIQKRVLKASRATGEVWAASRDGATLKSVARRQGLSLEEASREAARLTLTGLAQLNN